MNFRSLATIAVIGPGSGDEPAEASAHEVGRLLAQRRCNLITGGLGGVMAAASRGYAQARDQLGSEQCGAIIGILPRNLTTEANSFVDIPIATGIGEARNYVLVNSADAIIAVGKGHGTLVEIAYALRAGKRVVSLKSWGVDAAIIPAQTPLEAVELALRGQ